MATEADSSSKTSGAAADSYIGSLISLTSKSEIRYEGILYNINTEEASIGLRNVRSFGTEGRKKDGPQVPPSEKIYEYILFRGSDIKDLQVKSSPTVQTTPSLNNDPAIIQSHYPPFSTSATLTSAGSGSLTDLNMHSSLLGPPGSNFPGALPLYQPGGSLGSWSSSPSPAANGAGLAMPNGAGLAMPNGAGLAMPMYWQGYYGSPNGLPQIQQQSLLRPPPGLQMPPSMQQPMQYPNYNTSLPPNASNLPSSNLPEAPSPLLPASSGSQTVAAGSLPTIALQSNPLPVASDTLPSSTLNLGPSPSLPTASLSASLPSLPPMTITSSELSPLVPPISNKSNVSTVQPQAYSTSSQSKPSVVGESSSVHKETTTPSLITPGQLMQSGSNPITSPPPLQTAQKDVEVVQVSSSSPSELTVPVATEAQPPILPLPVPSRSTQKQLNGAPFQNRYGYRGRERGRGSGSSRPVTKFTEDFDFEAMNEKFKKEEVWGHLGKSGKGNSNENGRVSDEDDDQEDEAEFEKAEVKPVYNKDDFFDTLSCNALDHDSRNGRTRFSEQMKLDTETFGDFSRHRGGRGGRWFNRGGGGGRRGGYYGGGYGRGGGYGYGYGYGGKGRGRGPRAP